MGLFDFWKKKPEEETPVVEPVIEEVALEEPASEESTVDELIMEESNVGEENILLQEEPVQDEPEIEIEMEDGEIYTSEDETEAAEFVADLGNLVEEMLEHPTGEEEILVVTEDGECFVDEEGADVDEFLDALLDSAEEWVQQEVDSEIAENVEEPTVDESVVGEDFHALTQDESEVEPTETKKGFFAKLKEGLGKTRQNILGGVDAVLGSFMKIDEDLFEELEETLIMADMGVETTMKIVETLRKRVKRENISDPSLIKGMLIEEITKLLEEGAEEDENLPNPSVMMVIGVNGVGKTTTIGKLANRYKEEGHSVLLAAADTFRAAAIDQLEIWGERSGITVVKHEENSDPAAVVFDAVHVAQNKNADLLICDTAGRLHNKKNLMEELRKMNKIIEREYPQAHKEVYLVLDATTGQNALQQAKVFQEVAEITGIILTKLDGTAKGGIVVAIKSELQIPVRYIGVGEGIYDLQKFNAKDFARALFGE